MIHDISVTLHNAMPVWPESPGFTLLPTREIAQGDICNNSMIRSDLHVGTHIDAPRHFLADGRSVEKIPLDILTGRAVVTCLDEEYEISAQTLESKGIPSDIERLLIRTRNSALWESGEMTFHPDYVALTADAAAWIVDKGIKLVGIDYLSIQRFQDPPDTHRILLEADTVVVEGLNLHNIESGPYELICLPLKIKDGDGAPARAILRTIS